MKKFNFTGAFKTPKEKTVVVRFHLTTHNNIDSNQVSYAVKIDNNLLYNINFHRKNGNDFISFHTHLEKKEHQIIGLMLCAIINIHSIERVWVMDSDYADAIRNFHQNGDYPEIEIFNEKINGKSALLIYYSPNKVKVRYQSRQIKCSKPEVESILDSALNDGIDIKHLCKSGVCGKCRLSLLSGITITTVEITEPSLIKDDQILSCSNKAITSLEVR